MKKKIYYILADKSQFKQGLAENFYQLSTKIKDTSTKLIYFKLISGKSKFNSDKSNVTVFKTINKYNPELLDLTDALKDNLNNLK